MGLKVTLHRALEAIEHRGLSEAAEKIEDPDLTRLGNLSL